MVRIQFAALLMLFSFAIKAQYVLDAPFIYEKYVMFTPFPDLFNRLDNYYGVSQDKAEWLESRLDVYKSSYLYHESNQARVRVYKTLKFSENKGLLVDQNEGLWMNTEGNWVFINRKEEMVEGAVFNKEDFNFNLKKSIDQFVGVNIDKFRNDSINQFENTRNFQYVSREIDEAINNQWLKVNNEGVLEYNQPYEQTKTVFLNSFATILESIFHEGTTTFYGDEDFVNILTADQVSKLAENMKYSGLRIKEDYHYDPVNGKFTSSIIGIGFIGEEKTEGNELFWLYYPEFKWSLFDNYAKDSNGKWTSYDHIFQDHLYHGSVEKIKRLTYSFYNFDDDFQIQLDAKLFIQLQKERLGNNFEEGAQIIKSEGILPSISLKVKKGEIDGAITMYYPNDRNLKMIEGKMLKGKEEGAFSYYYSSGKVKAKRLFVNGKLEGEQLNYFESGQLYAKYVIAKGELADVERYHESGELMEKGELRYGVLIGEWEYRLKYDEEIAEYVEGSIVKYNPEAKIENNMISFKVKYIQTEGDKCMPLWLNYKEELKKNVCLDWTFKF